jgi:hypothetical protein
MKEPEELFLAKDSYEPPLLEVVELKSNIAHACDIDYDSGEPLCGLAS